MTVKTLNETAYIDGLVLHESLMDIIFYYIPSNSSATIKISSTPIQGYTKALKVGEVGKTTTYKSKAGVFDVCSKWVHHYRLGNQFYYKVNNL